VSAGKSRIKITSICKESKQELEALSGQTERTKIVLGNKRYSGVIGFPLDNNTGIRLLTGTAGCCTEASCR